MPAGEDDPLERGPGARLSGRLRGRSPVRTSAGARLLCWRSCETGRVRSRSLRNIGSGPGNRATLPGANDCWLSFVAECWCGRPRTPGERFAWSAQRRT